MGVTVREKVKGSGIYWIFINHNGCRRSKSIGSKKEAEKVAKQIKAKIVLKEFSVETKKIPKFEEYSEQWLGGYVLQYLSPSTYERYKQILRSYLVPQFGGKNLDEISRSEVKEFLIKLRGDSKKKKSIELVKNVLSGILDHAVDDELITINPTNGVMKRLKFKNDKQNT